jgi:hypothetical protein
MASQRDGPALPAWEENPEDDDVEVEVDEDDQVKKSDNEEVNQLYKAMTRGAHALLCRLSIHVMY